MRGGTSSALISGYSTFLRLRSEGRCCWRGRSEVFGIWHAAGARREARDGRREEKRRSAVGGSDGKNAFPPTHRARRPSMRGPYRTPAFRKSPRAAGRGRVRPRFQVSGFWGSIRRRRTFLGLVLVWPLVALGLTCVAARTTRRTGAPIMTAMFRKCGVRERGAARSEGGRTTRTAAIVMMEKAENSRREAWPAVRPRRRRPRRAFFTRERSS